LRTLSLFILFIALLSQSVSAFAVGKETLADISGVAVIVDEVSDSAREDGVKEADIKALVEKKLDKANIKLLEDRKWFTVFGGAYLLVKVVASKAAQGDHYAVYLDLALYQTVVLLGKRLGQNITTAAATWSVGKLLSCNTDTLKDCVEGNVSELTDMFTKDFTEVNSLYWKAK
jgi:hypothetical protein